MMVNKFPFNLITILGPTATGKTRVGVQVAGALGGEIISADSRQVYRGMNLGTGKDLEEYGEIPYHLIDIVEAGKEFSVFDYQRGFSQVFDRIRGRGKMPILVGGTGLYLESVLRGYQFREVPENEELRNELLSLTAAELQERLKKINPALHNTTDLKDPRRLLRAIEIASFPAAKQPPEEKGPDWVPIVFGIKWDRDILRQRISRRLKERFNQGMIEEVKKLHEAGLSFAQLDYYGLEYRYIALYLQGELNRNDMVQKLNSAIHQFAKRQETWFRRMERNGIAIQWVAGDSAPADRILKIVREMGAGS
jgi:tRNA dimethylallyltransferase